MPAQVGRLCRCVVRGAPCEGGCYHPPMRHTLTVLAVAFCGASLLAQQVPAKRPAIGQVITTPSGLSYKFTKLGKGPKPEKGDLMIIHGIGTLADGKEFWNTRTDNTLYEYSLGVDSVIRGFSEGMQEVRGGDRIIITMKPELGYGERGRPASGIPPNATIVFDYEILAVKPLSFVELMRDGLAAGTVDEAIARAKTTKKLKDYYFSPSSVQAAVAAANRKQAGEGEKVLAFAITLQPKMYQLHQSLAGSQARRGAKADAIKSYETALKLNKNKTPAEIRDHEATTKALADLRK